MLTNVSFDVPAAGKQRDIRSGRGLPTAFLVTSVMKLVKSKLEDQVSFGMSQLEGACVRNKEPQNRNMKLMNSNP